MKELLKKMAAVADSLDREGLGDEANVVTKVMEKLAQGMFTHPLSPTVDKHPIMLKWQKDPSMRRYYDLAMNKSTDLAQARKAISDGDEALAKKLIDRYAGDPNVIKQRQQTNQYRIDPNLVNPLLDEATHKGWNLGQLWSMARSRHNENMANNIVALVRKMYPNAPATARVPQGLKVDAKGNLTTKAAETYSNKPFDIMNQASSKPGIFKKAQPRDMEEFYNEGWNDLPSVDEKIKKESPRL